MKLHDATEYAFKNGYEKGVLDTLKYLASKQPSNEEVIKELLESKGIIVNK